MKELLLIISLCVVLPITNFGCDCVYNGPFNKVIKFADVVARVKILNYTEFRMINGKKTPLTAKAQVLITLKGKTKGNNINIWGDNGQQCRPYIDTFVIGKEYVIALKYCSNNISGSQERRECG